MSDKKDLKIHSLSKNRFRELKYFCQQYYEWEDELRKIDYALKAYKMSGLPKSKEVNKPTEKLAVKKTELEKKINIVKQSAKEASPIIYQEIIQNVAQGIPFRYLNIHCGINQFYDLRNKFFLILDKKQRS